MKVPITNCPDLPKLPNGLVHWGGLNYRQYGEEILVFNVKKKSSYVIKRTGCSCEAFQYRGACKHWRGLWELAENG